MNTYKHDFLNDGRFAGIAPFEKKVWLSSPTMHGEELAFVREAMETNWVSTVGANMCQQVRGEKDYTYKSEPGKSCPQEILDAMSAFNAEGRPIWKPMHMQPIYSVAILGMNTMEEWVGKK